MKPFFIDILKLTSLILESSEFPKIFIDVYRNVSLSWKEAYAGFVKLHVVLNQEILKFCLCLYVTFCSKLKSII